MSVVIKNEVINDENIIIVFVNILFKTILRERLLTISDMP